MEDKEFRAFPKAISLKVNILARLEFEHVYYDFSVQLVSHNATEALSFFTLSIWIFCKVLYISEDIVKMKKKKKEKCGC